MATLILYFAEMMILQKQKEKKTLIKDFLYAFCNFKPRSTDLAGSGSFINPSVTYFSSQSVFKMVMEMETLYQSMAR